MPLELAWYYKQLIDSMSIELYHLVMLVLTVVLLVL